MNKRKTLAELVRELDEADPAPPPGREEYQGDHTIPVGLNGEVYSSPELPAKADAEVPDIDIASVARISDLEREGAKVEWVWKGWIQKGVLTAIAAPGGTGKTRFCADLVRRILLGHPWPDDQPMAPTLSPKTLWVVSDNHHDEMVTLAHTFGIKEALWINATAKDPYGGVSLDDPEDVRLLEARIKVVRPTLVVIDTVGNATDRNLSRQEEAKAFYWPLQIVARKYRCAILCLTHLNASGQFLGRRVLEKVRTAIRMVKPDDGEKRRLEVKKTNARLPDALGLTMHDDHNEYDNDPPEDMPSEPGKDGGAADWLRKFLQGGAQKVCYTIDQAKMKGISKGALYRGKALLKDLRELELQGLKYWELTSDIPQP